MTKISNQYSLTNVLFADPVNGRVGIGTATPGNKLVISQPVSTTFGNAGTYIGLGGTENALGQTVLLGFGYRGSSTSEYPAVMGYLATNNGGNQSGALVFGTRDVTTNTAPTERMRITSAGNVGIGTSSPAYKLHVAGDFNANTEFSLTAWLAMKNISANILGFGGINSSQWDTLAYYTSGTERMRITSGGNVGIGTTAPAVRLQIDGTNNQERFRLQNTDSPSYLAFTEQDIRMWRPNDSGSALVLATQAISGTWTGGGGGIEFRPLNTLRMTISPTGNIGAPSGTNIYNASDARLKQNISQITYGLDAITALNPVKFNWVDGFEPSEDGKDMLGFVAQEVLEVLPEAVEAFGTKSIKIGDTVIDNPLRVNEKFIIPVLVKAIQELKTEIEILKQK